MSYGYELQFSKKNLDWGQEIVDKYPLIFKSKLEELDVYCKNVPIEDRVNLRFGFECGPGWSKLIEEICETGTKLLNHLHQNGQPTASISAYIVKEKFGTLRWQGGHDLPDPISTLWYNYVSYIENKSDYTCEVTGRYGQLVTHRGGKSAWHKTLCKEEALKQGYDWEE